MWNPETKAAQVKCLHKDDGTFEGRGKTRKELWQAYIASFVRIEPTEEVDVNKVFFPFPRRRIHFDENFIGSGEWMPFGSEEKMGIRVDPKSFGLQTVPLSYDWMTRRKIQKLDCDPETWTDVYEDENRREEVATEQSVMNNEWMKGLTRDEVDAMKTDYETKVAFKYGETAAVAGRDSAGKDQVAKEPELEDDPEKERSQSDEVKKTNLKRKVQKSAFKFESLQGWNDLISIPIASIEDEDEMEE